MSRKLKSLPSGCLSKIDLNYLIWHTDYDVEKYMKRATRTRYSMHFSHEARLVVILETSLERLKTIRIGSELTSKYCKSCQVNLLRFFLWQIYTFSTQPSVRMQSLSNHYKRSSTLYHSIDSSIVLIIFIQFPSRQSVVINWDPFPLLFYLVWHSSWTTCLLY